MQYAKIAYPTNPILLPRTLPLKGVWTRLQSRYTLKPAYLLEIFGGRQETRTPDLLVANEALFQLS